MASIWRSTRLMSNLRLFSQLKCWMTRNNSRQAKAQPPLSFLIARAEPKFLAAFLRFKLLEYLQLTLLRTFKRMIKQFGAIELSYRTSLRHGRTSSSIFHLKSPRSAKRTSLSLTERNVRQICILNFWLTSRLKKRRVCQVVLNTLRKKP